MKIIWQGSGVWAIAVAMTVGGTCASGGTVPVTPVVYTGQPLPGAAGGTFVLQAPEQFDFEREVDVALDGTIAFRALHASAPSAAGNWVWTRGGGLSPVVFAGSPGGGGFSQFANGPRVNSVGQVAYFGNGGLYLASPGAGGGYLHQAVAVPSAGGIQYVESSSFFLNDAGQVVFGAGLKPPVFGKPARGYFVGSPGELTMLVETERLEPFGYPANAVTLRGLDASGRALFSAGGPEVPMSNAYLGTGATDLRRVASPSDVAPGTGGMHFGDVSEARVSRNGHLAVQASLLEAFFDEGIWSGPNASSLTLIVSRNQLAPGAGLPFRMLIDPAVNDIGDVAFLGTFDDMTGNVPDHGIWFSREGVLTKVIGPDQLSGDPNSVAMLNGPMLNNIGQVAFLGRRRGLDEFGMGVGEAIFAGLPGALVTVATRGDTFVLGGSSKVVEELFLGTGYPGEDARALADTGDLVFVARFTDGTHAILVAQVPVPEPGSAVAAATVFASLACRRSRRGS
jgi:hypothetical protein